MTRSKDQLKRDAARAREDVVASVGDLGTTIQDARARAMDTAKRVAPVAGAAVGSLILLRIVGGRRRRRRA